MTRNATLDAALDEAKRDYTARNPQSLALHERAAAAMPGGNTRSVLYYDPFPVAFVRGEGARLWDLDGHAYTDLLGEFTAGVAGHSNPAVRRAVMEAMDAGINLGGHNTYEPRFSALVQARFPAMELLRFTNSGTEANLLALSLALAATEPEEDPGVPGRLPRRRFQCFAAGRTSTCRSTSCWPSYNDTDATLRADRGARRQPRGDDPRADARRRRLHSRRRPRSCTRCARRRRGTASC